MDGLQKPLNDSIQRKLSFALSVAILVVATLAGIFSFMAAFDEAHELQDDVLREVARLVDRQRLLPSPTAAGVLPKEADDESRVIVQRLGEANSPGLPVDEGGSLPLLPTLSDGMHTLNLDGETFRVLVKTTTAGERIAVAQEFGSRDEIARNSALRTVLPFLVLVPVLLLIVADLVRKLFRPIALLAHEIDQRAEQALHPVPEEHIPAEVRPFVVAINRLLARVAQSMNAQRRFIADAAHELRSPLTAMSLQAERLDAAEMSTPARERVLLLRQGIERGKNLLEQLLALAKAEASTEVPTEPPAPVSIQRIYRRVLEDLMPLADAKHIDIGVEGTEDARVAVSELDLIGIVKNLVDNAIRYTPEGGQVDLSVRTERGYAVLQINDNGPGIPLAERERVFDPFYRTVGSEQAGSGLGLSIVQAIAHRIGANIRLSFTDEARQSGLTVSVLLPDPSPLQAPH